MSFGENRAPDSGGGVLHARGRAPARWWVLQHCLVALQEPRGSFPEMMVNFVQFVDKCGEQSCWSGEAVMLSSCS